MKKFVAMFIIFTSVLGLAACSKAESVETLPVEEVVEEAEPVIEEIPEEPEEEIVHIYGNTVGNIYNLGILVSSEDENYYRDFNSAGFYTLQEDWTAKDALAEYMGASLNYWDGKIYSLVPEDENRIYVYDCETKDYTKLLPRPVAEQKLFLMDGFLYYGDAETNYIYTYDIEKKTETVLLEKASYYIVPWGENLIFQLDEDGESLYLFHLETKELQKLNEKHSYYPITYENKVYYSCEEEETYSLRCVDVETGEDAFVADAYPIKPTIWQDKLFFRDWNQENAFSYIDLKQDKVEVKTIDLLEPMKELFAYVGDVAKYFELAVAPSVLTTEDGMFLWIDISQENPDEYTTVFVRYDFATGEFREMPIWDPDGTIETLEQYYHRVEEEAAKAKAEAKSNSESVPEQKPQENTASTGVKDNTGHNYYKNMPADLAAQADAIAQSIADSIMGNTAYTTDLQRVKAAADVVAGYTLNCTYGNDAEKYYRSPVGVFVTGVFTCAGSTRALGLVLEKMGFSWSHARENQNAHQWCILTMDGQTGFADGMGIASIGAKGAAGYGEYYSGITIDGITREFP